MLVRVAKIEETQSSVIDRLENLEQQNEGLDDKICGAIYEQREIDSRKLNIMCFGLKENTQEDEAQRKADDKTDLVHLIRDILEFPVDDLSLDESIVRIGKFEENKTRPIKFKALSFENKKKLLESARIKLKDQTEPGLKDIFFKSDLTKKTKGRSICQERK